jgi:death-on-curing family protein
MKPPELNNNVVVFKPKDGKSEFQVELDSEQNTVWVSEQQIMELFGKARRTIGEHIKNIYKEGELEQGSTRREFRQVQIEGGRKVSRTSTLYNLDVIISVGYRVKSKIGVEFRKWATQRLKEYLIKGYSINNELLIREQNKVAVLKKEISLLNKELVETQKTLAEGFLSIISTYAKSFELLEKYDKDNLSVENLSKDVIYIINYEDVKKAIRSFKSELIKKGEASEFFGREKDDSFKGILGSISQTVFGELAYPTIEEQAVQLLYSTIKGHPFSDGNKRIGSFLFVWFLEQNNYHLNEQGDRKINNNTLVALALTVAKSQPEQRQTMQKLIINLIKKP